MKQNGNIYTAEPGNFIVRKEDDFIMGESIDLGSADSIDNYKEEPYTEESYRSFYESIGMTPPKDLSKEAEDRKRKRGREPRKESVSK